MYILIYFNFQFIGIKYFKFCINLCKLNVNKEFKNI